MENHTEESRIQRHRLTARYNLNNNAIIDDDPVDVYAYDRLWRVRTVTRATPSGSSAEATWTYYVREKWYYHDTESGQEMMTGSASTDAPVLRRIDTNGDGDFDDSTDIEHHFVNDHQGSTVLVTGKATLDPANGNLVSRGPIIAHVKYDQYGVPKFVHPADANSDGVVDADDLTFWKQAWNEYFHGTGGGEDSPPKEIWKGVADANENGTVDNAADPNNQNLPSATNTDWVAFQALHTAGLIAEPLDQQLGNLPLYAGYWWDDAIGLYHVRHRVYRPEWGRWLQRDPLGYAPGWNLYQYVNGMPWSAVDPMGLWAWVDRMRDWATNMASEAMSEDDVVPFVAKHLAAAAGTAAADILDAVEGTGTQMAEDFAIGISPSQRWGMNIADKARKRFDSGESVLESITYTIIDEVTANAPIIGGVRRAANSDLWWYERAGGAASAVSDVAGFAASGLSAAGRAAAANRACNSAPAVATKTMPNTTLGWKVGQPINNLTSKGNVPKWNSVRSRFWKNEAHYSPAGYYSSMNLERMKKGLAPQRINPKTGQIESMELHHTPAQRDGGLFDVVPVWPEDHAALDPFRHLGS